MMRASARRSPGPRARRRSAAECVEDAVRSALDAGIAEGVFPGAAAVVWRGDEPLAAMARGFAQLTPRRIPMRASMVFDLASLTKPVATATAILHLSARGMIDLDAPVSTYLPAFAQAGKAGATVRHLLAHTSGLPAWQMLYLPGPPGTSDARLPACRSIDAATARICATAAKAAPGAQEEYSDLGFIALGVLVQRHSGEPLDRYASRHIFAPLGMRWTRFVPPAAWRSRCVATERGNAYERARALEQGLGRRFAWRTRMLRGQVHDGNAWHVGRGIAGHAGLFGTAADLARFGRMVLRGGALDGVRVLPEGLVREAVRDHCPPGAAIRRGLGWVIKAQTEFGGPRASAAACGHTGFTGTSILIDPPRDLVIVLLTNRVHPAVRDTAIVAFRPRFYDAVLEALDD